MAYQYRSIKITVVMIYLHIFQLHILTSSSITYKVKLALTIMCYVTLQNWCIWRQQSGILTNMKKSIVTIRG